METPKPAWEIAITYYGVHHYIVNADDGEKAKEIAERRFNEGDNGEILGNEYEEIGHVILNGPVTEDTDVG